MGTMTFPFTDVETEADSLSACFSYVALSGGLRTVKELLGVI